ncbi:MAG: IS1634 family transposase [Campylobacterota bacterium]|nr:IS1634 family transposase [Campylobacterota bacterium]
MSIVKLKNKKNGVTYVYESSSYWDKEKNQARNSRTCIGKLDPDSGEVIYNKRYLERCGEQSVGRPASLTHQRLFCGATHLFDKIGTELGIDSDLKACFGDSYRQILSMAYYLILEDRSPMSRFTKWARTHEHPYNKEIPSQRSSEIFASISEDAKQRFFSLQSARRLEEEYLAYDTTSISSYSQSIKQVKYGVNKDHDPLAQINLALLLGQSSRLPVSYRKLPGNISDVKTIKKLISDLEYLDIKKVKLVLDRGFYSRENVNALYHHHYKFLLATKISSKLVKPHLESVYNTMVTRSNYSVVHALYSQSFTTEWDYAYTKPRTGEVVKEKRRIYLHIYYNDQRATDEKMRFNKQLDQLEEELLTHKRNPKHEKLYSKYFTVHETPVRGIQVQANEEAIRDKEKNFGYFTLISNSIKESIEAIDVYRSKDLIEKAYDDLKNRLSMRRTSVSSEESLDGKLFVQFVALIYVSYIKQKMDTTGLFKKYTLQGVLDELDIIERFTQPGKVSMVGEVTKKQMELYRVLGVEGIS